MRILNLCLAGIALGALTSTVLDQPDYYLEINERHLIYIDVESGDTLHVEPMNWEHPTELQKKLIKNNL